MTKKEAPPNYDYTAKERVQRQREALAESGGARIDVMLSADEVARLNAFVATGKVASRRAAVKYLVQQLPDPAKKKA